MTILCHFIECGSLTGSSCRRPWREGGVTVTPDRRRIDRYNSGVQLTQFSPSGIRGRCVLQTPVPVYIEGASVASETALKQVFPHVAQIVQSWEEGDTTEVADADSVVYCVLFALR